MPVASVVRASLVTEPATQVVLTRADEPALIELTMTGYGFGLLTVTVTLLVAPGYRLAADVPAAMTELTAVVAWAVAEPEPVDDQAAKATLAPNRPARRMVMKILRLCRIPGPFRRVTPSSRTVRTPLGSGPCHSVVAPAAGAVAPARSSD